MPADKSLMLRELIQTETRIGVGDPSVPPWRGAIEIITLPIIFLGWIVFYMPFTSLAFLASGQYDFFATIYLIAISAYIDVLSIRLSWSAQAIFGFYSIIRFLKEDIIGRFRIEEFDYFDCIPDGFRDRVLAMRVRALKNTHAPFRGFQILPSSGRIMAQQGGSPLPLSGEEADGTHVSASTIFLSDPPDDLTSAGRYALLHEIGHTTKFAWRRKSRSYIAIAPALLTIIFFVIIEPGIEFSLLVIALFLIRPLIDWIDVTIRYGGFRNLDECIADQFALTCWSEVSTIDWRENSALSSAQSQVSGWRLRIRQKKIRGIFESWRRKKFIPLDSTKQAIPSAYVCWILSFSFIMASLYIDSVHYVYTFTHWHYMIGFLFVSVLALEKIQRYFNWRLSFLLDAASVPIDKQYVAASEAEEIALAVGLTSRSPNGALIQVSDVARSGVAAILFATVLSVVVIAMIVFFGLWIFEYVPIWLSK